LWGRGLGGWLHDLRESVILHGVAESIFSFFVISFDYGGEIFRGESGTSGGNPVSDLFEVFRPGAKSTGDAILFDAVQDGGFEPLVYRGRWSTGAS